MWINSDGDLYCTANAQPKTDFQFGLVSDIISQSSPDLDLTRTHQAQRVVDQFFEKYFSHLSIKAAESSNNTTAHNFRICLRDLASVIEADQSQRAGDIGRLLLMWKRWSVMAQGKSGLTHYSKHLPRLVTLLTTILPSDLAQVVKHSMLIPTGDREGHWVAKDFYLEQMNYLLKYFYNNSVSFVYQPSLFVSLIQVIMGFKGNGTDIKRLTNRFSVNILLVSSSIMSSDPEFHKSMTTHLTFLINLPAPKALTKSQFQVR